jgi:pyridoxamine 5'-phosphate oxidase
VAEFAPLRDEDLDPDPIIQFADWFQRAAAAGVAAPEAMALATASAGGRPSVRMVLMKQYDERGFVFYSNYESHKGEDLRGNPYAALLFYWEPLGRQVRIEGAAQRLNREESAAYARTRARASQLSAHASPQSRAIESRVALEQRVADLAARYEGADLPLPEGWGGYRVVPEAIEFWQHRADRLHDRLLYSRDPDGRWRMQRLAP